MNNEDKWSILGKTINLGDKFGRLTVMGIFRDRSRIKLNCRCACGTLFKTQGRHVVSGKTTSCGCYRAEYLGKLNQVRCRKPLGWASFNNLFHQYRAAARKRKHEFTLTREQFKKLTQSHCVYCGFPPAQEHCAGYGAYVYNGLDRVNNDGGYTPENTAACCFTCNRAKGTRSAQEYRAWLIAAANFVLKGQLSPQPEIRTRYFKCRNATKS